MRIGKLLAWSALASGLSTTVPAPVSAQIGGLIKKKVQGAIAQAVGGSSTAAASPAAQGVPGPVFNAHVLEITPALLDQLEKALAAEAATRDDNARRLGKVLAPTDYDVCKQGALSSPAGQKLSEELSQLLGQATTQAQASQAMQEMATRLEAFLEPACGLEPGKAEKLRSQLTPRVAAAGEQAAGLNSIQLSILKERILPFCAAAAAAAAATAELRLPTASSTIFWVYSPTEVKALLPRCGSLAPAVQAGS